MTGRWIITWTHQFLKTSWKCTVLTRTHLDVLMMWNEEEKVNSYHPQRDFGSDGDSHIWPELWGCCRSDSALSAEWLCSFPAGGTSGPVRLAPSRAFPAGASLPSRPDPAGSQTECPHLHDDRWFSWTSFFHWNHGFICFLPPLGFSEDAWLFFLAISHSTSSRILSTWESTKSWKKTKGACKCIKQKVLVAVKLNISWKKVLTTAFEAVFMLIIAKIFCFSTSTSWLEKINK